MTKFGFPKARRLRSQAEFARVYDARRRASDEHLLVYAAPNAGGATRIGLSVSRRLGGAVRRARLKRLLREAFRLSQQELPAGLDLILIPKPNSQAGLDEYRGSLLSLSRQLARRLKREAES
jgi:ribonuclease P protein component